MSAVKTSLAVARSPAGSRDSQPDWPAAGSLAAPAERASFGKAARGLVPRECHAELELAFDRPDPVDLLEMQARTRLPELVPVRYGRMLVSPFAYFRGTALPMASDLAATPVTGFTVQACGDAHLGNFGVFAAPDGRQDFDINDFDETMPGPWEWDVKRLAASIEIAGRENGFGAKQRRKVVLTAASSYREAMLAFARMTPLDIRYARLDLTEIRAEPKSAANGKLPKAVGQGMISARTKDSLQALAKLTAVVDGRRQIIADPPLIVPVGDLAAAEDAADAGGRVRAGHLRPARGLPARPSRGKRRPAGRVRAGQSGQEGRGRRRRRHAMLDRADAGQPRLRSALPSSEGSGAVGTQRVRRP